MKLSARFAFSLTIVGLSLIAAAESPPPACKPVEHYGVKGCEPLPDQTCPPGYHKQAVNPPNPMMKTPTYLMCVADQPQPKDEKNSPKKSGL